MPAILILAVYAVGRDLISCFSHHDCHCSVPDPRIDRAAKQCFDLFWFRIRSNIPVIRRPAQQAIPHTASDGVCLIARFF